MAKKKDKAERRNKYSNENVDTIHMHATYLCQFRFGECVVSSSLYRYYGLPLN